MIALGLIAALLSAAAALYIVAPLAGPGRRAGLALASAGAIALGALAIYVPGSAPGEPGQPHRAVVARLMDTDPAALSLEEQEERLRAMVRQDPGDQQAIAVLGRLLARTERELEAIAVLERALRLGEDARILSDLGQALVNLNEGEVTEAAERAFAAAYRLDPDLPEPAFFLGVAAYQAGDRERAAELWGEILSRLEPGDPFRQAIAARAADLLSRPSAGPGEDGEAPFAAGGEIDTEAMISQMIARLEERLEDDPDDFSGWLILIRARATTGQGEAARTALETARARFDGEGEEIMLSALARALGLAGADAVEDTQEQG